MEGLRDLARVHRLAQWKTRGLFIEEIDVTIEKPPRGLTELAAVIPAAPVNDITGGSAPVP